MLKPREKPEPPPADDTEAARVLEQEWTEDDLDIGLSSDDDMEWIPF